MLYWLLKPSSLGPFPPGLHGACEFSSGFADRCHFPIQAVWYPSSGCESTSPIVGNPCHSSAFCAQGCREGGYGEPASWVTNMHVCCEYNPVRSVAREGEQAVAATKDRKSTRLNSSHLGISYAVF